MQKNSPNRLGFTILELLLVIALIAILATTGLSYYQRRTQAVKITKEVLQIQQILQAANAFYLKYRCWPTSYEKQNPTCIKQVLPFQAFVPIGSNINSWGTENQIGLANQGANSKKFAVTVARIPANEAAQIANRLPNAFYSNGILTAEISIPNSKQPMLPFIVKTISAYNLNDGQTKSTSFLCPPGWTGKITTFISGIYPAATSDAERNCDWGGGTGNGYPYAILNMFISSLMTNNFCVADPNIPNQYNCTVAVTIKGRQRHSFNSCNIFHTDSNGSVVITYMGYCVG